MVKERGLEQSAMSVTMAGQVEDISGVSTRVALEKDDRGVVLDYIIKSDLTYVGVVDKNRKFIGYVGEARLLRQILSTLWSSELKRAFGVRTLFACQVALEQVAED